MLIVDDVLLLRVLAGKAGNRVREEVERGELFATACWYYRLSRAVHDRETTGVLSNALVHLDQDARLAVLESLDELPERIGLLSWRRVVPVMSAIDIGRRLNLLAAEALAAALVLGADIAVTTDTPLVREGAAVLGVGYRIHP